jgi:hypothetical protein
MTHEERARSVWRKIVWRLYLEGRGGGMLTWEQHEEAIALIACEIAMGAADERVRTVNS